MDTLWTFSFQFVLLMISISDTYLINPERFPEMLLKFHLCILALSCLNKSSGLDVRPGCWCSACWVQLLPGFSLHTINTHEKVVLGYLMSRTGTQGEGHLFYLRTARHEKYWDASPEERDVCLQLANREDGFA